MSENLANDTQTLLSGGINNAVTAITTTGNTGFPAANFRVLVDNELMLVTSVGGGTNWTVIRGIENTTAIAHLDQAPIVHVVTTTGLTNFIREQALSLPCRQTVLAGALSSGLPAFFAAGSGLALNLSATATAVQIAFAAGFGVMGEVDLVSQITADVASFITALPATNTSYLTATYVDSGSVTWGQTLIPPQYGYTFDRARQALLRMAGANTSTTFLDDYGNTWTATGTAQISTGTQIDGLNTLAVGGSGAYIGSANFTSLGYGSWTLESKIRFTTLPSAGTVFVFNATNAGGWGLQLGLNDAAGTKKLLLTASANGTSADIASGVLGTSTTWATATTYHLAVVYDALAGKYFVYKDGVLDLTVTSTARICGLANLRLASNTAGGDVNGNMAGFRLSPFCRYPNGTTFTVPNIATFAVEGDFFSIPQMKMFGATAASGSAGTDPTFTAKNLVYIGEADTGAATVSAVRNYAYQGRVVTALQAAAAGAAGFSFTHNIGIVPNNFSAFFVAITTDQGYPPGQTFLVNYGDNATTAWTASATRYIVNFLQTAMTVVSNLSTGARGGLTAANWKVGAIISRGW